MIRTAMDGQEDPGRFPSVAILGLSGRFPGARSPSEFWANLRAGREAITGFCEPHPGSTREAAEWAREAAPVHVGGPLAEAAGFDAAFFGMSVAAASALTAEQRLFLECAWEAFEHAGYVGERVLGPVAVFAAPGPHASGLPRFATAFQNPGPSAGSSERDQPSDRRGLSTLVSRQLNLTGPSLDVHAAGASSLAAVHLACQSLLNAECDMALAGGSTVHPDGETHCGAYGAENLSPDGHCRPFEARAAGTVLASGVACVVLKRLEDAVRDGDQILAVIRGSAINNAGEPRAGDTAPGLAGQVRAVSEALAMAGVQPEEISYIEAHGAGTRSGDAIEILALTKAFRARTAQRRFCAVGSVKGNIGHTGEAAGIAGLVKVVLALQHRQIPASLHVERPNPEANFGDSPFYVNTSLRDWTVPPGQRRIAGVTALGEGGTNAHLVVEEAPDPPPQTPSRAHHILVLSARTPAALETLTDTLAEQLRTAPDTNLADVSYTLLAGRKPWPYRRVVVARDAADAVHALTPDASGRAIASTYTGRQPSSVVWLFPGGGYYAGMGAGLAACEPAYRHALDDALSTLDPDLEAAVRGLVCQPPAASGNRPAEGPARTLPALVAVQYAIGCQLQTWGIPPSGMMGEGVGEYAAACFAGVFDIGQAMTLAAFEGRLLEGLASGPGEGPVQAPPADTAIEDPLFGELERFCRGMPFKAPARPLISNATGAWITSVEAADPAFWARRPRSSRGAEGIQTLLTLRDAVFVEIGPGTFAMSPPAQSSSAPAVVACTIRQPDEPGSDVAFLLNAVGRLWAAGVPVEASRLFPGEQRRRVGLGTYPFERQRRWSDPGSQAPSPAAAGPAARPDMADWFLWPAWERSIPPPASALPSSWLVLTDDSPLAADIVAGLRDSDHRVATVRVGSGFALVGPDSYTVDPGNRRDYEALARALQESDRRPERVLHLWAMAPRGTGCGGDSDEDCEPDGHYRDDLALDYFSLQHLARTFGAATSELHVYCVSTQVQAVAPGDELHPRKAVLLGPCLVSPREYPGVSCTSIDIDWPVTTYAAEPPAGSPGARASVRRDRVRNRAARP